MTSRAGLVQRDEQVAGLIVLTVYARGDLTVCSRVLQGFTVRRFAVERFIADFSGFDHREVRGLEGVVGDVMRMSIVVSLPHRNDLERIGKFLNRLVDVYKVEHTYRV